MEKYIIDERTGLRYELVGDYYLIAGDDDEEHPIGVWGRRHLQYLKRCNVAAYDGLMMSGKLNAYLFDINSQAEDLFFQLVRELTEKEGITEQLKVADQMVWVQRMNAIRSTAAEIVNRDLIFQ